MSNTRLHLSAAAAILLGILLACLLTSVLLDLSDHTPRHLKIQLGATLAIGPLGIVVALTFRQFILNLGGHPCLPLALHLSVILFSVLSATTGAGLLLGPARIFLYLETIGSVAMGTVFVVIANQLASIQHDLFGFKDICRRLMLSCGICLLSVILFAFAVGLASALSVALGIIFLRASCTRRAHP